MTFEDALEIAKEESGRLDIDLCYEDEKAFVFSKAKEISFGGDLPIAILKSNGKAMSMVYYIDTVAGTDILYTYRRKNGTWNKQAGDHRE